ncbi:hypothetical protein BJ166DRAFT_468893 [Pestalotiopsis sp. NC0098]|nr:hypothetical protein BJ166DRAFT_468893 [Pestalotiopsis sp. NC0098]
MLPYVEVSSLPPSASFYSAVTHPLGLKYISASPGAIVFGAPSPTDPGTTSPVFEVRSTAAPTQARLVLSAASPSVVQSFRAAALRAAPELLLIGGPEDQRHLDADPTAATATAAAASGDCRAQARDRDGNIMEVVFSPDHAGSTFRRTHTSTEESSQLLSWNPDAAASSSPRSIAPGAAGGAVEPYVLRRSVTTSVIESSPSTPLTPATPASTASSTTDKSSSLSSSGLIGSVLGAVAAGAAIGGAVTYMNMKGQREKASRQDYDAPAFHRRSTYPEPMPDHLHHPHQPRYVERTVEKVYYADQLPPSGGKSRHYPPPSYMARYSQAGGDRSREVEELDDRSSRYTAPQSTSGRSRTRSEAGSTRRPLMIADAEYRSNAGSSRSHAPTYLSSRSRSYAPDAETYVSSRSKRSERSESTIKPTRQSSAYDGSIVYGDMPIRSAAPSKAASRAPTAATQQSRHSTARSSATTKMTPAPSASGSRATARMVALPESRVSYTSARQVPLPGSQANWEDDDNDSIAPSDSISCIGINPKSQRA